MIEVAVLVPLKSNQGTEFSSEHHAAFERFVLDRCGGLSRLPGTVSGKWLDKDQTYVDDLVTYVVAIASLLDATKIGEIVRFARLHYAQEAIYLRYLGIAEVVAA